MKHSRTLPQFTQLLNDTTKAQRHSPPNILFGFRSCQLELLVERPKVTRIDPRKRRAISSEDIDDNIPFELT